jgi:P27 family predicted phage terminase small subunit
MPTNLRMLHGEQRPSRISPLEPKPRDLPPAKPDWLSRGAAAEWDRIVPDLVAMRTATAADSTCLAAYCEAAARFRVATELVAKAGLMLRDRDGVVRKNPAVAQARDASIEMRMWAREFGLTPASRAPLRVEHSVTGLAAERLLS